MQKIIIVLACSQKIIYPPRARLRAENHLSKTIFDVRIYMQKILIVSASLAILLTLAPFYPPGNTKIQQEMVAFVWRFQRFREKKTLAVGGNISFLW